MKTDTSPEPPAEAVRADQSRRAPGSRPTAGLGWDVWRAVIGLAYLAAAFNTVYTLPRSDEEGMFDDYAEGAWFGFLEDYMSNVFNPNGELFMTLVIVFEVAVGLLILNRGRGVDVGVVASVGWVLAVLPFLAWPYLSTNLALAAVQAALLARSYDRTIWARAMAAAPARTRGR
jgi:hypothetical protein